MAHPGMCTVVTVLPDLGAHTGNWLTRKENLGWRKFHGQQKLHYLCELEMHTASLDSLPNIHESPSPVFSTRHKQQINK